MIVETIIAGLTAIFVSSLVFANAQVKRQRQWDIEDNTEPPPPPPPPKIYPFLHVKIGTPCPKCMREAKNQVTKRSGGYLVVESYSEGPSLPQACTDKNCKAKDWPHLHAQCYTCHYNWFMAPADEKEKEDDNRQPHPPGTQSAHQE